MEDFSIYHIPNRDIDWYSIQPTFFQQEPAVPNGMTAEGKRAPTVEQSEEEYENCSKPVSAYAMFFKERQTRAKKLFPHATFGDISRIVAAEWDALEKHEKMKYKKRTDHLRKLQITMAVKEKLQRICNSHQNFDDSMKTADSSAKNSRKIALAERQNTVLWSCDIIQ